MSEGIVHRVEGGNLTIWCPGCKQAHVIFLVGPVKWEWNGSLDKPTFKPSLKVTHQTHVPPVTPENLAEYKSKPWPQTVKEDVCHSVITNGIIRFQGDCTHELRGKSMPLEPF